MKKRGQKPGSWMMSQMETLALNWDDYEIG